MTDTANQNKGLIGALLGDVKVDTNVGISSTDLISIGATIFIAACLIFLAYFTFKKVFI